MAKRRTLNKRKCSPLYVYFMWKYRKREFQYFVSLSEWIPPSSPAQVLFLALSQFF